MSTLTEIETAVRQLTATERQHLLVFVAQTLRLEGQPLPRAASVFRRGNGIVDG
jgi:hypothetical protein